MSISGFEQATCGAGTRFSNPPGHVKCQKCSLYPGSNERPIASEHFCPTHGSTEVPYQQIISTGCGQKVELSA